MTVAFAVTEIIADTFEEIEMTGVAGSIWDLTFNVENRQTQFLAFYFEYTQDASTNFTIQASFEPIEARQDAGATLIDQFYKETYLDDSSSTQYAPIHSEAGKSRIMIPVSQTTNRVKITITPDVATGADTLVCFASEVCVKGNR